MVRRTHRDSDVSPRRTISTTFTRNLFAAAALASGSTVKVQRLLSDHASYAAIEGEHRRMHQLATRLLLTAAEGTPMGVQDYELFNSAVKSLRLEATTLKRELEDLLSHVDPLTGVNGRTLLLTVLRELHALVKRNVMPCSVVMMDLDHFKTVNDTYGHQAGDRVLIACAQYVMQHLRPYDKVFRYGGEEFVLTLQNASSEVALGTVTYLREGLAKMPISLQRYAHRRDSFLRHRPAGLRLQCGTILGSCRSGSIRSEVRGPQPRGNLEGDGAACRGPRSVNLRWKCSSQGHRFS